MALAGNIETIGLSSVFQFLSTNALSGLFRVQGESGELALYFDRGEIFFPEDSRRKTYSLGGVLHNSAGIPRDLLESESDDALERALLERGLASRNTLDEARRSQFEEEIYDLFLWKRARFEFRPGAEPPKMKRALQTGRGFRFNTTSLLMEAARRADNMSRIRHIVPSLKTIFQVVKGRESEVERVFRAAGINATHRAIDGRASLQAILDSWQIPSTTALGAFVELVDSGAIDGIERSEAERRFRDSLIFGLLPQSIDNLSYLLDTDPAATPPLEEELLLAETYEAYPRELALEARIPGPRVFSLLRVAVTRGLPFTLTAREDEHEKRISFSRHQLCLASTKPAATPKLVHYLHRLGVISAEDSHKLWSVSGKKLFDGLLSSGRVTKAQWVEALTEKIAEELVELFFWERPRIELVNRSLGPCKDKRPMLINLPLDAKGRKILKDRIDEYGTIARAVPSPRAVYTRRHVDQDPGHPFFARFDGLRPLAEIRRFARAGPLEFFRFVYNGVVQRTLRPITLEECARGIEHSLSRGDHRQATRFAQAVRALGLEQHIGPVLVRAEEETFGIDFDAKQDRLQGDLVHFSLAEVLQALTHGALSGTLRLTDGKQDQNLYFLRGTAYLLDLEQGDGEDFLELFSDNSAGEELLSGAWLNSFDPLQEDLSDAELSALKEQILNVFFWKDARFEFVRNLLPDAFWESDEHDRPSRKALDTQSFLMEVLAKLRKLDDIRKRIPSEEVVFEFVSYDEKLKASGELEFAQVVMMIDGRHSLEQLARATAAPRFELYEFLDQLLAENTIRILDPGQSPSDLQVAAEPDEESDSGERNGQAPSSSAEQRAPEGAAESELDAALGAVFGADLKPEGDFGPDEEAPASSPASSSGSREE